MNKKQPVPGIRYRVTKNSVNEELQVGDLFCIDEKDGALVCAGHGFIGKEDIPDAMEGAEFAVDRKRKYSLIGKKNELEERIRQYEQIEKEEDEAVAPKKEKKFVWTDKGTGKKSSSIEDLIKDVVVDDSELMLTVTEANEGERFVLFPHPLVFNVCRLFAMEIAAAALCKVGANAMAATMTIIMDEFIEDKKECFIEDQKECGAKRSLLRLMAQQLAEAGDKAGEAAYYAAESAFAYVGGSEYGCSSLEAAEEAAEWADRAGVVADFKQLEQKLLKCAGF